MTKHLDLSSSQNKALPNFREAIGTDHEAIAKSQRNKVRFGALMVNGPRNGLYKSKEHHGRGAKIVNMGELFANPRLWAVPMKRVEITDRERLKTTLQQGDLLFARRSLVAEGAGKCSVVMAVDGETTFESSIIRVRPNGKYADSMYLFYYFQSPAGKWAVRSIAREMAVSGVTGKDISNIEIPLPAISEQRAIAAALSCLDERIENNSKINHHLEQVAQAIFKSWFVKFEPFGGKMPSDWREGTLSDIATITMGQSPDGSSYNDHGAGTVFYQGRAEFGPRFPSRRLFTTQPKRMATKGDVLMSVRAPVGDLNIAFESCCLGRGLAGIQSKNCYQSFILYTMFAMKPQLDMFNGEGTVFGSINKKDMSNLSILIPTDGVLRQFEALVNPMDAVIEINYAENFNLQTIRDSLLPRLMSGELSVADLAGK